jgi:hypothetical protein
LVPPFCFWPTTLGTSKLHTTYNLYHQTLYMMFKHTNVPPNCHNPNHTTNHTWNFKIRQHLHLISSNFVHHAQVHNFSTQPQTRKVLGPSYFVQFTSSWAFDQQFLHKSWKHAKVLVLNNLVHKWPQMCSSQLIYMWLFIIKRFHQVQIFLLRTLLLTNIHSRHIF